MQFKTTQLILNDNPKIMFFKEFCATDECDKYVHNYNSNLKRSLVVDNKKNTENSERTSRSKLLNNEDISLKSL